MRRLLAVMAVTTSLQLAGTTVDAAYRLSRELGVETIGPVVNAGRSLEEADARDMEALVRANPGDVNARAALIAYYSHQDSSAGKEDALANKVRHLAWIAENQPWAAVADTHYAGLYRHRARDAWDRLKGLWLKAVRKYGKDARVLGNAAEFLATEDTKAATELYERAVSLEPEDPFWRKKLANEYSRSARRSEGAAKSAIWARALGEYEKAYGLERGFRKRFLLNKVAEAALGSGDVEKARASIDEYMAATASDPMPNLKYFERLILARIALAAGDDKTMRNAITTASREAIGNYIVRHLSPDSDLLEELLAKRETDTALEYLRLCEAIWPDHIQVLRDWAALIKAGRTPDFSEWYTRVPMSGAASATTSQ